MRTPFLTMLQVVCLAMALASAACGVAGAGQADVPLELTLTVSDGGRPSPADGAPAAPEVVDESNRKFKPVGAISFTYEVGKVGQYDSLQNSLFQLFKTTRTVETVPVMLKQTLPAAPPTWVLINLIGRTSLQKATLAVRSDNAYICGFNNTRGVWFAFPRFQRQLHGSIALPKTDQYGSLVPGGHKNLAMYDISESSVLDAVQFLSSYQGAGDKAYKNALGIHLARVIVVVSEAARFKPIYATVQQGLLPRQEENRMSENEAKLLVLWGDLSRSLIGLAKGGEWDQKDKYTNAGISSAQDAIATLHLLLWPKGEELPPATAGDNGI